MEPDFSGAAECCEEESLTSEQGRFDASHLLDIEADLAFESNHATGVDMEYLTRRQLAFHDAPAGMYEDHPVAFQLLHDETFPAEEAGQNFLLEVNTDLDSAGSRQKAVFLADQSPSYGCQIDGNDAARVRGPKGYFCFTAALVSKDGDEEALARQQPFARSQQFVHETTLGSAWAEPSPKMVCI